MAETNQAGFAYIGDNHELATLLLDGVDPTEFERGVGYWLRMFNGDLHGALDLLAENLNSTVPLLVMTISPEAVAKIAQDYTDAWNSKSAEAVASFYAEDGEIVINRGDAWRGRDRVAEMASGFYADVPDLTLTCDDIRCTGNHAVFVWTFTGHDADTGNRLTVRGWEEWNLGGDLLIKSSRGWFDADDYARQVSGG